MKVYTGCISDKGNYRAKNQDRAVCHGLSRRGDFLGVACICDGIGSFERSEIAAEMMTAGITRWFDGMKAYYPQVCAGEALREDLEATIRELNEIACDYSRDSGIDMGCTMSVLLLMDRHYHVFHVGDSRICCVRDEMYQLTRDEVSMREAHGMVKSCLANYIGKSRELWMSKMTGDVEDGDIFLLGSDGLFKGLTYQDVVETAGRIRNSRQAQKACKSFLKLVLERGEKDNVSCIMMYVASAR